MNTKVVAVFVVFLLIAALGFTRADWLDDLNEGASQVVSVVNENAGKLSKLATNIDILGKILKNIDPDSSDE